MKPLGKLNAVDLGHHDVANQQVNGSGIGAAPLDASSSQEAIERCRSDTGAIDLLISDVVMPQINGVQLAQQLRKKRRALKVLLVSGYGEGEGVLPIGTDEKTAFLQKPFTTFDLAHKVRGLCDL